MRQKYPAFVAIAALLSSSAILGATSLPVSLSAKPWIPSSIKIDQATPTTGHESNWLRAISQDIKAREYRIGSGPHGIYAYNRANNVTAEFTSSGVKFVDVHQNKIELADIGLTSVGRGSQMVSPRFAGATIDNTRIERHWGDITEWYENRSEGIEQGYVVAKRARGHGPLALKLHVAVAKVRLDTLKSGTSAQIISDSHRKFQYSKLQVLDAEGHVVPAMFRKSSDHDIAIQIDDSQAVYPIVVDPIYSSDDETILSGSDLDTAGSNYGLSVASAGDVNHDGFADVLVGAPGESANGLAGAGNVYVYYGSPAGLSTTPSLILPGTQSNGAFGTSVASAGDVNGDGYSDIIVGAPGETSGSGTGYVYYGSSVGLVSTPSAILYGTQANGQFGSSVSSAGDVNGDGYGDVIVGAPGETTAAGFLAGNAYVFPGSKGGLTSSPLSIVAGQYAPQPNGGNGYYELYGEFGSMVGSAGDVNGDGYSDVIVIAAVGTSSGTYVFYGSPNGLLTNSPASLLAPAGSEARSGSAGTEAVAGDFNGDGFTDIATVSPDTGGYDLSIYYGARTGIPSIPREQINAPPAEGEMSANTFSYGASTLAVGDFNGDGYADLAITQLVGKNPNTTSYYVVGEVNIYLGSAAGLSSTVEESVTGNTFGPLPPQTCASGATCIEESTDGFGYSVAATGDINGDGSIDLIVGAPYDYANDLSQKIGYGPGVAYVFYGPSISSTTGSTSGGNSTGGASGGTTGGTSGGGITGGTTGATSGGTTLGGTSGGATTSGETSGSSGGGSFSPWLLFMLGASAFLRRVRRE